MKIAIHNRADSYSEEWIKYCDINNIQYKIVDCYKSDIVNQIEDCDALMWHFHHALPKDILFARQLLYSIQTAGKYVFPDFETMWHFDDKIGQKYLLEAFGAPLVPSHVFYSKTEALQWIDQTTFPKVFKLRVGASSQNVKLVKTKAEAYRLVKRSFGGGFKIFNPWTTLQETIRKYKLGETSIVDITKSIGRLVIRTDFEKFVNKEKGYIYFQDFIPDNDSDIRVVVIDNKAFAEKRFVRKNDFRASGSHMRGYDKELINESTVKLAFEVAKQLKLQCVAFDFIYHKENPLIVEISFGTSILAYKPCPGYWDKDLGWHEGEFNFCGWMVDSVVNEINNRQIQNSVNKNTTIPMSSNLID